MHNYAALNKLDGLPKLFPSFRCNFPNLNCPTGLCYTNGCSKSFLDAILGKNWIKAMILTASLFPFMCFGIGLALNTIAIFYRSLAAIPFGTMVVMFVLWAFISFPLALLGTVVGRNWSGAPNNPCRVKTIPRPIPEKKWYLTPLVVAIMGGLLPFGSIFIEMYFVFTSFWNYKVNLYVSVAFFFSIIVLASGLYVQVSVLNYNMSSSNVYQSLTLSCTVLIL